MPAIVNEYCQPKTPNLATPKACEVSRDEFCRNATPMSIPMPGGCTGKLKPMTFATGSFGWNGTGKAVLKLANGQEVTCQFSGNFVVINSKAEAGGQAEVTVG